MRTFVISIAFVNLFIAVAGLADAISLVTSPCDRILTGSTYRLLAPEHIPDMRRARWSEDDVARARFVVKEGQLTSLDGTVLRIARQGRPGKTFFVMTEFGTLHATNYAVHHPDIVRYAKAAAAGELSLNQSSELVIRDQSGHYLPKPVHTRQFLEELLRQGLALEQVWLELHYLEGVPFRRASALLPWMTEEDPMLLKYLRHVAQDSAEPLNVRIAAALRLRLNDKDSSESLSVLLNQKTKVSDKAVVEAFEAFASSTQKKSEIEALKLLP